MIGTLETSLTCDQVKIIKTVLYFDVFNYPLTINELFDNSAAMISKEQFGEELAKLLHKGLLKQQGDYILSVAGTEADIQKRLRGNEGARGILPTAYKYSRRIGAFPFVEGVCLSGGLSKNYYDHKSDIDYFIITRPGRLWICRSLLILWYKLLPKDKKKFWCVNYFISSDNLAIPDVNAFTGTELAYLVPCVNYGMYLKILEKNKWYRETFPNMAPKAGENCAEARQTVIKSAAEKILGGSLGNRLEAKLFGLTLARWRKKFYHMNSEDFDLQFRSRKDACKRHVHGFQNKVLIQWEKRISEFEGQFEMSLGE